MAKRDRVQLSETERQQLIDTTTKGKASARKIKRANILRLADQGQTDTQIATILSTTVSTVHRTRQRFVQEGVAWALNETPRCGRPKSLDGKQEAFLIAIACTDAPEGRKRSSVRLLADQLVELNVCDTISRETVRRTLKKNETKPWRRKQGCFSQIGADFIWRMEAILDLYAQPYDPLRPVISFDETPYQLIGETRIPLPVAKGMPALYDYEDQRNGTCNLFVIFNPFWGGAMSR